MYKVEDFVITIYCLLEDELYPAFCQQHGLPRRAGFAPALSDSECLTIALVGPYLGYTSQKQLYEQMRDRWRTWFPALKDRGSFTRPCANLWQVKAWMHHHLVEWLGGDQAPCQIIDTLPVPICHIARRFQRRIFCTHTSPRCVASTKPMDDQNTDPFHLRMAQYTPEKTTPRLGRTRTILKVTHHVK